MSILWLCPAFWRRCLNHYFLCVYLYKNLRLKSVRLKLRVMRHFSSNVSLSCQPLTMAHSNEKIRNWIWNFGFHWCYNQSLCFPPDFKCKDEGFFPHPRDCKKYFWCLDSGPSNLGIVAHQFTCPSGKNNFSVLRAAIIQRPTHR